LRKIHALSNVMLWSKP